MAKGPILNGKGACGWVIPELNHLEVPGDRLRFGSISELSLSPIYSALLIIGPHPSQTKVVHLSRWLI